MRKTTKIYKDRRNQYFKRRRGDIVLPPEEQEVIQTALEKAGVTQKRWSLTNTSTPSTEYLKKSISCRNSFN